MTFIYSFLQKRKMSDNQSGIIMVVMAYVLSILMLALGSDLFYSMNLSTEGIKTKDEEAKRVIIKDSYSKSLSSVLKDTYLQNDSYNIAPVLQEKLVNPYNLPKESEREISNSKAKVPTLTEETVWFLGSAMDTETFDSLMEELEHVVPKTEEVKEKESKVVKVTVNKQELTITEKEIKMLERIVEAEASGEDTIGKILVANVILNRITDDEFPDTVEEVIFQKSEKGYQFSPIANKKYWSVKVSKETKKAVARALEGEDYSKGALYFIARKQAKASNAKWFDNNLKWLFKHGGHEFYKNK